MAVETFNETICNGMIGCSVQVLGSKQLSKLFRLKLSVVTNNGIPKCEIHV